MTTVWRIIDNERVKETDNGFKEEVEGETGKETQDETSEKIYNEGLTGY